MRHLLLVTIPILMSSAAVKYYNLFPPLVSFSYDYRNFTNGFTVHVLAKNLDRGYLEFVSYVNYREGSKSIVTPVEFGSGKFFGKEFVYVYVFGSREIYTFDCDINRDIAFVVKKVGDNKVKIMAVYNDGGLIMSKTLEFGDEVTKVTLGGFNGEWLEGSGEIAVAKVVSLFDGEKVNLVSCGRNFDIIYSLNSDRYKISEVVGNWWCEVRIWSAS